MYREATTATHHRVPQNGGAVLLSLADSPLVTIRGNFLKRVHYLNRGQHWESKGNRVSLNDFFKDKYNSYRYFSSLPSVQVPQLYLKPTRHDLVRLPVDRQTFILKPNRGVGSKGVMSLERRQDGSYFEARKKEILGEIEIRDRMARWARERPEFDEWIVEERIVDPTFYPQVADYKFFAFDTHCPVCLVSYTHPRGYGWVDNSLNFVDTGVFSDRKAPQARVPSTMNEMFRVAEQIQHIIPSPFSRIDLFNTQRGIILGEVTPTPARPSTIFNKEWERWLNSALDESLTIFQRG